MSEGVHIALGPLPCARCGLPLVWVRIPTLGLICSGYHKAANNRRVFVKHECAMRITDD